MRHRGSRPSGEAPAQRRSDSSQRGMTEPQSPSTRYEQIRRSYSDMIRLDSVTENSSFRGTEEIEHTDTSGNASQKPLIAPASGSQAGVFQAYTQRRSGRPDPMLHQLQATHQLQLHSLGVGIPTKHRMRMLKNGQSTQQFVSIRNELYRIDEGSSRGSSSSQTRHALPQQAYEYENYLADFHFIIEVDSYEIEITEGAEIPPCECNKLAQLRCLYDTGQLVWTCAFASCCYLEELEDAEEYAGIVDAAVAPPDVPPPDTETVAAIKSKMADLDQDDLEGKLKLFWQGVSQFVSEPDADVIPFLVGRNRQIGDQFCACNAPCSLAVCQVTADLYWICATKTCNLVTLCLKRQDQNLGQLDIGQIVRFGDSNLDRYTTLQHAMRWFGQTFSVQFWDWLKDRPADADYPKGSFQLDRDEEYTGFISYRGGSGRLVLQSTLCAEFNFAPALYFFIVFCSLLALCLSFIPDVCESSNASSWEWLLFADSCDVPNAQRSWFIFRFYGRAVVIVIILFWHPMFSWFYRGQKWFVDKLCIHQSDISKRTTLAVARLPLFLKHSQRLYVLFDCEYTTRLWCVFELAVYLRLRENPKVVFVSIDQRILEFIIVLTGATFMIAFDCIHNFGGGGTLFRVVADIVVEADYPYLASILETDAEDRAGAVLSAWFMWGFLVFVYVLIYIIAERHALSIHTLRETLTHFDVSNSKLAKEDDRIVLLGIINHLFQEVIALDADAPAEHSGHADSPAEKAQMLGQQLHEHVTAQQSPGSVQQEAGDQEADEQEADDQEAGDQEAGDQNVDDSLEVTEQEQGKSSTDDGLAAFNHSIKVNVRDQLPTAGIRSWCMVGYKAAVLLGALATVQYSSLSEVLDFWGYGKTGVNDGFLNFPNVAIDPNDASVFNFSLVQIENDGDFGDNLGGNLGDNFGDNLGDDGSNLDDAAETFEDAADALEDAVDGLTDALLSADLSVLESLLQFLGVAYMIFVINPFQIFLIWAHVRFWLTLHAWSKLPRWTNYAFFFPAFLFIQLVICLPWLFNQNVMDLFFTLVQGDKDHYTLYYQPMSCTTALFLFLYHDTSQPMPQWYYGYSYAFSKETWIDVLLWIFMVIPMGIFTYWYWEHSRLRGYRLRFWTFLMQKMFGDKDGKQQEERPTVETVGGIVNPRDSI